MKYERNPPDAAALMTSARSFGNYNLPSALADLLDNSIKAKAGKIDILCLRENGAPTVRILDDGHGMTEDELFKAMRPASANPEDERAADDLGRFGWGMKSASLSQCRKLTVLTRKDGKYAGASWDLDDIADWQMGVLDYADIELLVNPKLLECDGTEIIWEKCDRLSEFGKVRRKEFNELLAHAKSELALTFHRYLAGETGVRKKLKITFNNDPLEPIDPFLRDHPATQARPVEHLELEGKTFNVQAFILPHYSKISAQVHERLGGEEGFVRNQGFYVYREHRLIMHGTWFRLVRHGELSQLVRIAVNIPNSLDAIWKITVDKSEAQLPSGLRSRLREIVKGLKGQSGKVFQSRGGRIRPANGQTPVWAKYVRSGELRYYLNREHPLIASLLEHQDVDVAHSFAVALSLVEDCFPAVSIGEDFMTRPEMMNQSVIDRESFLERLDASLPALLAHSDGSFEKLWELLRVTEPWGSQSALVEEYLREKGWWTNA
ncbi:ATP-binding protein [Tritonibacter scottomollicae]|uniref:ATP-binding protein n=1 Tax=Tritonibacter scottomollicae TaxID=483013 RepID=UPI003BAA3E35